ncbi:MULTISPECIES: hypothetical protein [Methylobacterium]|uniref:hypothetical protein n=1 Tax=Methylobacterium TaxID=407 RepID=UPI001FEFC81C|nr:hypothetical protein [Methylobacterium sp. DB0501]
MFHEQERLAALAAGLHGDIADPLAAKAAAMGMLAQQVRREADVMACADGVWPVGVSLASVAVLKTPQRGSGPVEAHRSSDRSTGSCGCFGRRPS